MADMLSLDLVDKGLVTDQLVLTIGYDKESLSSGRYAGEIVEDYYGRKVPKHGHGTINLEKHTSSARKMTEAVMELFDRIVDNDLLARRINLAACNIIREENIPDSERYEQLVCSIQRNASNRAKEKLQKEKALSNDAGYQYVRKNAVLKGRNFSDRNCQGPTDR